MDLWTYTRIEQKLWDDCDIEDEDFISSSELMGYVNEAIRDCEAEIHKLGLEDYYFLQSSALALVTSTSLYSLPSDLYANKLRGVLYSSGSTRYEIIRMKSIRETANVDDSDDYMYLLIAPTAGARASLKLYPSSRETSASNVTLWYIRNAKQISVDADVCDIPEFINYILQSAKVRIYEKEGNPNVAKAIMDKKELRDLMISTLQNMVEDENNLVTPDVSFYNDFDFNILER
jgi:hypothetical protein